MKGMIRSSQPSRSSADLDNPSVGGAIETQSLFPRVSIIKHGNITSCSPVDSAKAYNNPPMKQDWQRIRPLLTRLYLAEGKPLREVMAELADEHDFHGSVKMYKTYLACWHLRRNMSLDEVVQILGIANSRKSEGKETRFHLRGQLVDMDNVHRYQRRKGLKTSDALSMFNLKRYKPCPDLVILSSPAATPVATLAETQSDVRCCLLEFRAVTSGLLECGLMIGTPKGLVVVCDETSPLVPEIGGFKSQLQSSLRLNDTSFLFLIARKIFLSLEWVLERFDQWSAMSLLELVVLFECNFRDIAKMMVNHIHALTISKKRTSCPSTKFWTAALAVSKDMVLYSVVKLYELLWDMEDGFQTPSSLSNGTANILMRRIVHFTILQEYGFYVDPFQIITIVKRAISTCHTDPYPLLYCVSGALGNWPEVGADTEIAGYLQWLINLVTTLASRYELSINGHTLDNDRMIYLASICALSAEVSLEYIILQHLLRYHNWYNINANDLWYLVGRLDQILASVSNTAEWRRYLQEMKTELKNSWLADVERASLGSK